MPTIKDVAHQAGVSVTTVSRVLNSTAPVNEKTKENILNVIKELRYTPSIVAQGMRTKKSKTLGIIIPDYVNSFYYELFKCIELVARQYGYNIIVTSVGSGVSDEIDYLKDLVNRNVDGLVVCTYQGDQNTIKALSASGHRLPIVYMDNIESNSKFDAVYTDGYTGIKEIIVHLINGGHKEIAFVKAIPQYNVNNDRYQGYIDALRENGLVFRPEHVYAGTYDIESGYEAARYFFGQSRCKPTAIVSSTDLMAIGAMNYAMSIKLRIPEDVAITGFDDIHMSKWMLPPITTYRQPIEDMAEQAVKILINRIKHPKGKVRQIKLKGKLIIRQALDLGRNDAKNG